jgi:hypothetical protein
MTFRNAVSMLLCVTALIAGVAVSAEDAKDQIRSVERERLRSLVNADMNAANRLHANDFQLINPLGGALTKDLYLGQVASGEIDYLEWEPGPIEVRAYGDSAVIRYQATLKVKVAALPDAPSGRFWHTDLYEKRDGRWQVVWSQATQIR